jgi:RNA polymerase sigma-70 factor (ECF subfamily)
LAVGIVGSRPEAEDIVQELYERLWKRRETIVGYTHSGAYIMASARNMCLDRLRARRPQVELMQGMASENDEKPAENDVTGIVERLVAALPEGQRTVMRLRDVECMEVDEIAAITGMQPPAVRMALSRARGTVKEKLVKILNYGT